MGRNFWRLTEPTYWNLGGLNFLGSFKNKYNILRHIFLKQPIWIFESEVIFLFKEFTCPFYQIWLKPWRVYDHFECLTSFVDGT